MQTRLALSLAVADSASVTDTLRELVTVTRTSLATAWLAAARSVPEEGRDHLPSVEHPTGLVATRQNQSTGKTSPASQVRLGQIGSACARHRG